MKINKKLMAIMMTLAIGGALVGCSVGDKPAVSPDQEVTTPEVTPEEEGTPEGGEVESALKADITTMTEGLELPMMNAMMEDMFKDTYGIDTNLLKDYYVDMPMMMVHSTEIAIFELNDEADADKIMEGIEKRQQFLADQWQTYLPDQYELVQNYKTAVKGDKILFVVSEYADKIVENFNA
ncbi:MAG: DUF4358 domain-containing protein, partial [Niameybacter sp.]